MCMCVHMHMLTCCMHMLQVLSELQLNLRLGASERAAVVAQEFQGCTFLFAKLVGLRDLVESADPRWLLELLQTGELASEADTEEMLTWMRNATFATVSQPAVRKMAQDVFEHLHSMDLRFHLDRQTGALTRALDRGSRGINFIMSAALFNVVPTVLEIGLVSGIMYSTAGWEFAAVTVGTMTAYTLFTINVTQWRTHFRLDMNRLDNEAGRRALDSLLNYETVKYFNNEVCGDVM